MCALFFIFLLLSKASYVPYGVKPCQKQVTLLEPDLRTELANGNMNQNSQFVASLGFTSYGINAGIWWVSLVEMLTGLFLNCFL